MSRQQSQTQSQSQPSQSTRGRIGGTFASQRLAKDFVNGRVTADQVYERNSQFDQEAQGSRSNPYRMRGGRNGRGPRGNPGGQSFGQRVMKQPQQVSKNDMKNIKEFVRIENKDTDGESEICKFQLVISCIPSFEGDFPEQEEHDSVHAMKILNEFDAEIKEEEIVHVQRIRSPIGHEMVRVLVYFDNTETPDRLATKAERQENTSMVQRSLPKHMRERNVAKDLQMEHLNSIRPQNCAYLWTKITMKGMTALVKKTDPAYQKITTTDLEGAAKTVQQLHKTLAGVGATNEVQDTPLISMNQGLQDLSEEAQGDKDLMIKLLMQRSHYYQEEC